MPRIAKRPPHGFHSAWRGFSQYSLRREPASSSMDVPPHRIPRRAFSRIYDLRPRLAVLAALLDDWASRPLHQYLPKWNIDDDDDDEAIFPRRPPFELRRSYSARKPDDGLYWMFDDELLTAGRGSNGLKRSQTHHGRRPRSVDELRSIRRQYFEGRDETDDGEVQHLNPQTKYERQVPVQVQTHAHGLRVAEDGGGVPMDRPMFDRLQTDRSPTRYRSDRISPFERFRTDASPPPVERPVRIDVAGEDDLMSKFERRGVHEEREVPVKRSEGDGAGDVSRGVPPSGYSVNSPPPAVLPDPPTNKDVDAVSDGTLVPLSLLESERRTIRELREENLRLKAVISNLQEVNKRWQSFNGDRQTYIQRLLTTIEEQQTQLNGCLDALQASRRVHTPAPVPYEGEASRMVRLRTLQREVADLQRRLEEAKKEHRETVALLQMQVETHKDDWEAERREKQAAETKLKELSRKMSSDDNITLANKNKQVTESKLFCKCIENKDMKTRSRRSITPTNGPAPGEPRNTEDNSRRCYATDIVTDGAPEEEAEDWAAEAGRDRKESQYAFTAEALSSLCGQSGTRGQRQTESPSDALTPTPTPYQLPNSGYPVELSGSASSLASCSGSCPAPHVSIPSSSRASTPDPDVSMCSDVTLDCSPPSPIQGTLTVGFNSSGLASVTSFRLQPVPLTTVPGSPDIEEVEDAPALENQRFWESEVPTNSRENITCPSCGDIFTPSRHLQFLDHFEICANPSLSRPRR